MSDGVSDVERAAYILGGWGQWQDGTSKHDPSITKEEYGGGAEWFVPNCEHLFRQGDDKLVKCDTLKQPELWGASRRSA